MANLHSPPPPPKDLLPGLLALAALLLSLLPSGPLPAQEGPNDCDRRLEREGRIQGILEHGVVIIGGRTFFLPAAVLNQEENEGWRPQVGDCVEILFCDDPRPVGVLPPILRIHPDDDCDDVTPTPTRTPEPTPSGTVEPTPTVAPTPTVGPTPTTGPTETPTPTPSVTPTGTPSAPCDPLPPAQGRLLRIDTAKGYVIINGLPLRVTPASEVQGGLELYAAGDCVEFRACIRRHHGSHSDDSDDDKPNGEDDDFPVHPEHVLQLVWMRPANGGCAPIPTPIDCVPAHEVGAITEVNHTDQTLTVDGTQVEVTSGTRILRREDQPVPFSFLVPGLKVAVRGCTTLEGTLRADVIRVEEPRDPNLPVGEFETHGFVEALDLEARTLTVAGLLVRIHENTQLLNFRGEPAPLAAFVPGTPVEVKGLLLENGSVRALRVKMDDDASPGPGAYLRGLILEVDLPNSRIRVNDVLVTLTEATVITGRGGVTLTPEALTLGRLVEVEGLPSPGGITALRIHVEHDGALEIEFRGLIEGIEPGIPGPTFIVAGRGVLVTPNTRLLNRENEPLTLEDFHVGDFIEVEAVHSSGMGLIATKLKKKGSPDDPSCHGGLVLVGVVDRLTSVGLLVEGRPVLLMNTTEVLDRQGQPIPVRMLEPGSLVRVQGRESANTAKAIEACRIVLLADQAPPPPPVPDRIVGRVESVDSANRTFLVNGITAVVVDLTEITDHRGNQLPFEAIQPGRWVSVTGQLAPDEAVPQLVKGEVKKPVLIALRVRLLEQPDRPAPVIRGFVTETGEGFLKVGEQSVQVPSNAEVRTFRGLPATFGDVSVGDLVLVTTAPPAEGTENILPVARRIRILAAVIESVDTAAMTLSVSGLTVEATTRTLVLDAQNGPTVFSDLVVGDLVRVEGHIAAPGVLRASMILRLSEILFSGEVPGFLPTIPVIEGSEAGIRGIDNRNTFGFLGLAQDSLAVEPDTLYEVQARIRGNLENLADAPNMRLRANNQSFQKGAVLTVESVGDGHLSPPKRGETYLHYFQPAAVDDDAGADFDDWFLSLDLLNVTGLDAADTRLFLSSLRVRSIPTERIEVVETLLESNFQATTQGWAFGAVGDVFAEPLRNEAAGGALDLAPTANGTFGFWTRDTGVTAMPGALYRARFLVRANAPAADQVPTFRARLNLSGFHIGSFVSVESVNGAGASADAQGRLYDVYLRVPPTAALGQTILASFDLVHFNEDDALNSTVSLEHFTLERVRVAE